MRICNASMSMNEPMWKNLIKLIEKLTAAIKHCAVSAQMYSEFEKLNQ